MRRAYINVTGNITDVVAFRVTPDVAARQTTTVSGLPAGGDRQSRSLDGSLVIRLKYAFGQFNLDKVTTHGSWIRIGQQQTPYVDFMEGIYRYRFQGTIFVEREGFLSSSDVGLSGRWRLPDDYGDVHVGYYNGDTYSKAEANDQKAFQIRGTLRPLPEDEAPQGPAPRPRFYDDDHPVKSADRDRFIGAVTFEHKYVNARLRVLSTRRTSRARTKAEVKSERLVDLGDTPHHVRPRGALPLRQLQAQQERRREEEPDACSASPTGSRR